MKAQLTKTQEFMNINKELESTLKSCLNTAIRRWFDLQGSSEHLTEKQRNEVIKAFDIVYSILSLIDINLMDNYESSNELDQIVNISKILIGYLGSGTDSIPDFTGYMINTLTQDQLTRTLTKGL